MNKIGLSIILTAFAVLMFSSCSENTKTNTIAVTLDNSFTKRLCMNNDGEFSGGDGCISIDLGNGKSLFLWGDSFIGTVKNNQRDSTSHFIGGNVFTVLDAQKCITIHGGTKEHPTSLLLSDTIDGHKAVLWPQHGFVKNNILHLFLSTIVKTGHGTWDFYWHSTVYYRLSLPDFKVIDKEIIPADTFNQIHFGYGFIEEGNYEYFYGSKVDTSNSTSQLYTARAQLINNKLSNMEYFDGENWQHDAKKAAPADGMNVNLSEQFSILNYENHYFLITQERGYKTNNIYSMVADRLTGPWRNKRLIYTTPEPLRDSTLWSYNAMAHPQYIKNGELLIDYCVNTDVLLDLGRDASIYRPRFFWVKLSDLIDKDSVTMDTTFCKTLMPPWGGGVTGADGAISIDLQNGKSLFMWGDAFFGNVAPDGSRANPSPLVMGNVFTVMDKNNKVNTYHSGTDSIPSSYITATPVDSFPTWYWPGNGFVRNGVLHLFLSKFYRVSPDMWGFRYSSCDYVTMNANTLKEISRDSFPAARKTGIHFGHAVLDDGQYVYVYGTRMINLATPAPMYVARAELINNKLTHWKYYTGTDWSDDVANIKKLEGITQSVSEQFNMIKLNGKYVLVTQDRLRNVKDVYSYIADSPVGPFYNEKLIYTVNEPHYISKQMMTYNTMVHPQYQKEGKILMCYNVNTHDFFSHYKDASLYQPRFFWVPISKILNP